MPDTITKQRKFSYTIKAAEVLAKFSQTEIMIANAVSEVICDPEVVIDTTGKTDRNLRWKHTHGNFAEVEFHDVQQHVKLRIYLKPGAVPDSRFDYCESDSSKFIAKWDYNGRIEIPLETFVVESLRASKLFIINKTT